MSTNLTSHFSSHQSTNAVFMTADEYVNQTNKYIHELFASVCTHLQPNEQLRMNFEIENSLFMRFQSGKVRQSTHVQQESVLLELMSEQKSVKREFNLSNDLKLDIKTTLQHIENSRLDLLSIEEDPFLSPLSSTEKSYFYYTGDDFNSDFASILCDSFINLDFNGLWTSGPVIRASLTSMGSDHFFASNNFFLDYSIYNGTKSVKSSYAGANWDSQKWATHLEDSLHKLKLMDLPVQQIPRGQYRVYLSPDAVSDIIGMLNWSGLSQDAFQTGDSAFSKLIRKEVELSPLFSIKENFELGRCPQFNSLGEVAPKQLPLIEKGILQNLLTNSRSFKEYGTPSNFANTSESMRSPEVSPGHLKKQDILKQLDTGIYISNLHYLNWSDQSSARVTGMTRFACFWVEEGTIKGPIEHLRFDESLLEALGTKLEAVTEDRDLIPDVATYGNRSLGGVLLPGFLIHNFTFTL